MFEPRHLVASIALVVGVASSAVTQPGFRTEWGAPDLRGLWRNDSLTPLERPTELGDREFYSNEELNELRQKAAERWVENFFPDGERAISGENNAIWMEPGALGRRTSLIVGRLGRIPPLTTAARARFERSVTTDRYTSHETRPLGERCLRHRTSGPPMLPLPFVNLVHVFQTPDHVALLHEESHELRIIPLDGRPPISPTIRLWRGDSRGFWDGDTLVVETRNFNGQSSFRGSGPRRQLTERFRRIDAVTIEFSFTISDIDTWIEPWTAAMTLTAAQGPMFEFSCHEGNRSLPLVLSGARVLER